MALNLMENAIVERRAHKQTEKSYQAFVGHSYATSDETTFSLADHNGQKQ